MAEHSDDHDACDDQCVCSACFEVKKFCSDDYDRFSLWAVHGDGQFVAEDAAGGGSAEMRETYIMMQEALYKRWAGERLGHARGLMRLAENTEAMILISGALGNAQTEEFVGVATQMLREARKVMAEVQFELDTTQTLFRRARELGFPDWSVVAASG